MSDDTEEWVLEYVINIVQSKPWKTKLQSFIDEKCYIFSNSEENKLSYTICHEDFKEQIDSLLDKTLIEAGISSDKVLTTIISSNSSFLKKCVIEQLEAYNDFNTFKMLMVKRNVELELEAIEAFRYISLNGGHIDIKNSSKDTTRNEHCFKLTAQYEKLHPLSLQNFQKTVMELLQKKAELEQLEYEQAIAISKKLNEDQYKRLSMVSTCTEELPINVSDDEKTREDISVIIKQGQQQIHKKSSGIIYEKNGQKKDYNNEIPAKTLPELRFRREGHQFIAERSNSRLNTENHSTTVKEEIERKDSLEDRRIYLQLMRDIIKTKKQMESGHLEQSEF